MERFWTAFGTAAVACVSLWGAAASAGSQADREEWSRPAGAGFEGQVAETGVRGRMSWSPETPFGYRPPSERDLPGLGAPVTVAQSTEAGGGPGAEMTPEQAAKCAAFADDIDADVGEIMRAGCQPTTGQMSRLMDNPLGNVAMWINQIDFWPLTNDMAGGSGNQSNYMGILQFPKRLSDKWNIINRIVYNFPSAPLSQSRIDALKASSPSFPPGGGPIQPGNSPIGALPIDVVGGRTTGFGDMYYVGLLSPREPIRHHGGGNSVWGVGLDLSLPTATDDVLGSGKWSAGPSALYAYLGPKWKIGGLWQQYFSFAGDSDRDDVNLSNIQYFVYYGIDETLSVGAGPNIIANWEADSDNRWTVPIGLGINKTIQMGKVPVRFGFEVHYNVVRPDAIGSDWDVRFFVIPAAPSALFKWMQ